jgi:hypothetical protein
VEAFFGSTAASIEHIRASKLRALEALPDLPTVGDCVPGLRSKRMAERRDGQETPVGIMTDLQ